MKRIFGSIIDIRKGEVALTLLMLLNYYLILMTYYLLKPARDSLFLVKVDIEQLPLVFIIIALVIAPITTVYSQASRRMRLNQLINMTSGIIIVNLLGLRWLVTLEAEWVYYLFYTWVSIYGALTTAQFWLLANAVYDAAQAKRLFALLGLAGIVGAITGGGVTSLIVTNLGVATENLLFFCMGFLALTMVLVSAIWKRRPADAEMTAAEVKAGATEQKTSMLDSFRLITRSRHLLLLVGIIGLTVLVASFADYQFKYIAKQSFETKDELTAFLGKFYSGLSLISLILQGVFAHRFLRMLGVGGVILFLPASLLIGAMAILISPEHMLLWAGILLRGGDGGLRYSLDKTGHELLFLPVPLDVKKKTKIFIDMFVDRWFRGLAGGLLLVCTMALGLGVKGISAVMIGFILVWIVLSWIMRSQYVDTFRRALERREIDPSELRQDIHEASTVRTLLRSLESGNERQIVYALEMLQSACDIECRDHLPPLLRHPSAEVRRQALALLVANPSSGMVGTIGDLLNDPDPTVRRDSVRYLVDHGDGERPARLRVFLAHPDTRVRAAAVAVAGQYGTDAEKRLVDELLVNSLFEDRSAGGADIRLQLAGALADLDIPDRRKYLKRLLHDSSPAVVREAAVTAGRIHDREFVPWLLDRLGDRNARAAAIQGLILYGERILGTLRDYLLDSGIKMSIRRQIPRVLSRIPRQESVEILTEAVSQVEPPMKYFVVKGLNSLRSRYGELRFDERRVEKVLVEETREYYELLCALRAHKGSGSKASFDLLERALTEKLDQNLERIFRLLGLRYPPRDIYSAYLGLVSSRRALRASAVEFLDNVLDSSLKKYLFPIIDEGTPEAIARRGQELFGVRFDSREAALEHLIQGRDPWLRACAVYQAGCDRNPKLSYPVECARQDPDPIVRETAELAWRMMEAGPVQGR